jgi:hypothetical protein
VASRKAQIRRDRKRTQRRQGRRKPNRSVPKAKALPNGDSGGDVLSSERVDRALAQVAALGVDWKSGRFGKYREELIAHRHPTPEFIAAVRADEARGRLVFETATQLSQLVMASTVWDRLDAAPLRALLKEIVGGPAIDPGDDDRPRNKLLELYAAAALAGTAFGVSLVKDGEDVRLDHPVHGRGAVECKRPKSTKSILHHLNEAGSQLRARQQTGSTFGVVVIGGDRIAQLASQGHEAASADEADGALAQIARQICDAAERELSDPACELLPSIAYLHVVVPGAVLIRRPGHRIGLRAITQVLDVNMPSASASLMEAFEMRPSAPLAPFLGRQTTTIIRKRIA